MKQELKLGLVGVGIVVWLTIYYASQYPPSAVGLPTLTPSPLGGTTLLTAAAVTQHNQANDCWIVFQGKVYNLLPNHLQNHPGGVAAITPFCGQDATTAFLTKGGRGNSHSNQAFQELGLFYLGDLNSTLNKQTLTNLKNNPPVINNQGREDD